MSMAFIEAIGNNAPWVDRAICSQTDPERFFPDKGGSTRDAKQVCKECPVKAECLAWALEHDERWGVWGGFSERERRGMRNPLRDSTLWATCGTWAGAMHHYRNREKLCRECRRAAVARRGNTA